MAPPLPEHNITLRIVFRSLVKSVGVIKKMKEILLTEKETVFLVLLYFHGKTFPKTICIRFKSNFQSTVLAKAKRFY